jgi:drug/metabolite transporter (DMT)-like permease
MVSVPSTPVANQSRPLLGIGLKVLSVGVFLAMASLLKAAKGIPPGEMVFFRSLFALIPIIAFLVWRGELLTGTRTSRPGGHLLRGAVGVFGQGLGFYALTQLPLAEVTAIQYTLPLLTVVAGALFLGENVRAYRWSAVILGMVGVAIIIGPRLTVFGSGAAVDGLHPGWGAISALVGCVFAAVAYVQVRRLVATERSATIVLYYSLMCALLAALTFPFAWVPPDPTTFLMLIFAGIFGGIGQVTLTESFRQADMSVVAPFEYVSLIFALIVGYVAFGDVPTLPMLLGSAILIGAGVFVIYREHQLGLARAREAATP